MENGSGVKYTCMQGSADESKNPRYLKKKFIPTSLTMYLISVGKILRKGRKATIFNDAKVAHDIQKIFRLSHLISTT